METVFIATNITEAHMIVHLLAQSGVTATILGEHLQGGVGELPAEGNIRVAVDAAEVPKAREVIAEWDKRNVASSSPSSSEQQKGRFAVLIAFLAGLGLASAFLLWAYNSPSGANTADYNRDGVPDEYLYWKNDYISRVEIDRNHDGEIDQRFHYSRRNGVETGQSDEDFDGDFEVESRFKHNVLLVEEVDLTGDGHPDRRLHYADGTLSRIEYLRLAAQSIKKIEFYAESVLLREAHLDSNNDGTLDTLIQYDEFAEEVSRTAMPAGATER